MPELTGQIGCYSITREIGRGGMGVVYLARDTNLDRDVAIKALPEEVVQDAERLARFEREAKTLAALNHSNIAQIYGIQEDENRRYLVLEYVPGETLDERLRREAIPIADALGIAGQIAEAIEAAHEQGIIHRDLKPANVKLVESADQCMVKVLDFGLAKSMSDAAPSAVHDSPTVAPQTTNAGVVLGTAGYLSPEQARGRPVDHRSDVFSFGCLLYEMLTGLRPFAGETVSDSIGAALHKEPDLRALPAETPPSIRVLIRRCLVKERRSRLQSIGDARVVIEEAIGGEQVEKETTGLAAPSRVVATTLPWAVCAILAIALALVLMNRVDDKPSEATERLLRSTVTLPAGASINWRGTEDSWSKIGFSQLVAISPDGQRIAVVVQEDEDGKTSINLKDANSHVPARLPGTEGARGVFFDPTGTHIGFLTESSMKVMRLPSGVPIEICEVNSAAFDATWLDDGTADGTIVYSIDHGLRRVSARQQSEPVTLTTINVEAGERGHHFPNAIPGSQLLIYTRVTGSGSSAVLLALDDAERGGIVVQENASGSRYANGHLIYARHGELLAAPFDPADPRSVDTTAESPIATNVHTTPGQGGAVVHLFAVSQNGTLIYAPQAAPAEHDALGWVDREGKWTQLAAGEGHWMHQRVSPTGDAVLFNRLTSDGMLDVWLYDIDRRQLNVLTTDGHAYDAEWSPDGRSVCFNRLTSKGRSTHIVRAAVGSTPDLIFAGDESSRPHLCEWWSKDGSVADSTLLFFDRSLVGGVWRSTENDGSWSAQERILGPALGESWAQISPEGNLIAYVVFQRGSREVFVSDYPNLAEQLRVSNSGGGEPRWADNQLLYFRESGKLYEATITTDAGLNASVEELPINDEYDSAASGHQHYDLIRQGGATKFLMVKHGQRYHPNRVFVIDNWQLGIDE